MLKFQPQQTEEIHSIDWGGEQTFNLHVGRVVEAQWELSGWAGRVGVELLGHHLQSCRMDKDSQTEMSKHEAHSVCSNRRRLRI